MAACCRRTRSGPRPFATVSDCEWSAKPRYFKSQRLGRLRHVFERVVRRRCRSCGSGRRRVTSSLSTSVGQFALLGRLDLAGVFAQLRRNVGQAERLVQVRLVAADYRLVRSGKFVFVEPEAARWARRRISMLCSLLPVK